MNRDLSVSSVAFMLRTYAIIITSDLQYHRTFSDNTFKLYLHNLALFTPSPPHPLTPQKKMLFMLFFSISTISPDLNDELGTKCRKSSTGVEKIVLIRI